MTGLALQGYYLSNLPFLLASDVVLFPRIQLNDISCASSSNYLRNVLSLREHLGQSGLGTDDITCSAEFL